MDIVFKKHKEFSQVGCDLDDYKRLETIKSRLARVMIVITCINTDTPIVQGVHLWIRLVREAKRKWLTWERQNPNERLSTRIAELYAWLQGDNPYQYETGQGNFMTYLLPTRGEKRNLCNCLCGTTLLVALGPYLGYDGNVISLFKDDVSTAHAYILVKDRTVKDVNVYGEGDEIKKQTFSYYVPIETTSIHKYRGGEQLPMRPRKNLTSWTTNDYYTGVIMFLEMAAKGIYTNNKKFSNLPMDEYKNLFNILFPEPVMNLPRLLFSPYDKNPYLRNEKKIADYIQYQLTDVNMISVFISIGMFISLGKGYEEAEETYSFFKVARKKLKDVLYEQSPEAVDEEGQPMDVESKQRIKRGKAEDTKEYIEL